MSGIDRAIFADLLRATPWQPATALWRAIEIPAVLDNGFPEGRGLDLGCGDGTILQAIAARVPAPRMTGVDLDAREVELARATGLYETLHVAGGEAIPEADQSFDFVFSNSVLEHVTPIDATLRESARVLRPGGVLIATVPAAGFHACLAGPWHPRVTRGQYLKSLDQRLAHLRYWTIEEWRRHLDEAGIELEKAALYFDAAGVRRWELLSRLTGGLLYHLTGGRRQPIVLQRALGLRRAGAWMPRLSAAFLARVLSCRLAGSAPQDEKESGCVLIVGRKR